MKTCIKCKEIKELTQFSKSKREKDGLQYYCRSCTSEIGKIRLHKDRERLKDYSLKTKYGITLIQYNQLFTEQNGCCLICTTHQSKLKTALCVDHNHETGEVRGLLCAKCNRVLGYACESVAILESAASYLKTKGSYIRLVNVL